MGSRRLTIVLGLAVPKGMVVTPLRRRVGGVVLLTSGLLVAPVLASWPTLTRSAMAVQEGRASGSVQFSVVPGTHGHWQQGQAVIPAPIAQVKRWMSDYTAWPRLYPDVRWAQVLGRTNDGRLMVRFHSSIAERTITLRLRSAGYVTTYEGEAPGVSTRGDTSLTPVGPGQTLVTMRTTSSVHGLLKAIVPRSLQRERAREKMTSDLTALQTLARSSFPSGPVR
jgi:hypothetical protein